MSSAPAPGDFARIGRSVRIQGEISGSEDIYIDGQVNGSIQLTGGNLTIGESGRVHANVRARNVTISGSLEGNIQASERTELRPTAVVSGDIETRRIAIREGAFFQGKLEIAVEGDRQAGSSISASLPSDLSFPPPGPSGQNK